MWPPAALDFLRELEANNDSEWFRANRKRYDQDLLGPARQLAESLSHLGEPHFFRPYNNLRFHPGPPLKEHLGVAVGYGGAGGYYFELSLDGLVVAGGMYRPAADQLERFRAALSEPELKRAPRGYKTDHPRLDYLRLKRMTMSRRHPLKAWLHKRHCDQLVRSELEAARPLVTWLAETVGPSTLPRRD
jgi:uncharacterized protein (DUF2461 family)